MKDTKNKIIFLDIDGVLNVIPQGRDEYGSIFHSHFVDNLKTIIDNTGAKIVISSTWRFDGLVQMQKMWKHRNLPGEIIDITPHIDICQRGKEIDAWLKAHKDTTHYVILDDDTDMLDDQWNNFVQTSENSEHEDCVDIGYGLTKKCAEKAIDILNEGDNNIYNITCGERDENGFADTYVNGKKTNVRMLLFDKEQVEKLHKIQDELKNNPPKKNFWKRLKEWIN